jgi:8-oxo-dGTP pyrophosphatase MutT (NUDIX family)
MMTRKSRKRYAGVLLVDQTGRFLFQQRDSKPGIAYPGRISVFGGTVEHGEDFVECAVRELREETGICASVNELALLSQLTMDDENGAPQETALFLHSGIRPESVRVTEGQLFTVRPDDLDAVRPCMTPEAALAVKRAVSRLQQGSTGARGRTTE